MGQRLPCIHGDIGKLQFWLATSFLTMVCDMVFMVSVAFLQLPVLAIAIVVGLVSNLDFALRVFLASSFDTL